MAAPNPLAQAHQSIGEYFVAFSSVELELGEAIKVVFGLRDNEAGDAQSLQRSAILRARRVSYGQLANTQKSPMVRQSLRAGKKKSKLQLRAFTR